MQVHRQAVRREVGIQNSRPGRRKAATVMIHANTFFTTKKHFLTTKSPLDVQRIMLKTIKLKHLNCPFLRLFFFLLSRPISSRFCKILNTMLSNIAGWLLFSSLLRFLSHWMLQKDFFTSGVVVRRSERNRIHSTPCRALKSMRHSMWEKFCEKSLRGVIRGLQIYSIRKEQKHPLVLVLLLNVHSDKRLWSISNPTSTFGPSRVNLK